MKNRTSSIIVGGLIILALFGIFSSISTNPTRIIQNLIIFLIVGAGIYIVVRRFSSSSPQKKEQRAFLKAAKKSKKRMKQKSGATQGKSSALGTLSTLKKVTKTKKKSPAHLTVINGKKGKKKNRASF